MSTNPKHLLDDPQTLDRQATGITRLLFICYSLASAGIIAFSGFNALTSAELSGDPKWAGLPLALMLLGTAFASSIWGGLMERWGRRPALSLGLGLAAVGTAIATGAIIIHDFILFTLALVLVGFGRAAMQLSRYAAAEVRPPHLRGRAISGVVFGGAIGAIAGPLLAGPSGRLSLQLGSAELAGPYGAAALLLALTTALLWFGMHPDPRELGRAIARLYPESDPSGGRVRSLQQIFRQPGVIVATLAMVLSQFVMVLLMVINSLHMSDHGHSLNNIALVVSAHTTGMFAFSVISGRLADRWGREPVIMLGAAILILACLLTPLSPQLLPLTMALFLLGLGWNLCYVGGSSLLADQLAPAERAHAQGLSDLLVGLASAFASLGSGLIFAALGIVAIGWMGVVLALIPLLLTKVWRGRHAPATTA